MFPTFEVFPMYVPSVEEHRNALWKRAISLLRVAVETKELAELDVGATAEYLGLVAEHSRNFLLAYPGIDMRRNTDAAIVYADAAKYYVRSIT